MVPCTFISFNNFLLFCDINFNFRVGGLNGGTITKKHFRNIIQELYKLFWICVASEMRRICSSLHSKCNYINV